MIEHAPIVGTAAIRQTGEARMNREPGRGEYALEHVILQKLLVDNSLGFNLNGEPQEITITGIQGFYDGKGEVSPHREPSDTHNQVTEMYFPLVGHATAYIEEVGEDGATTRKEVELWGKHTTDELERATFELRQRKEDPVLKVTVDGRSHYMKPALIISPGTVHGTYATIIEGDREPRYFALKLKKRPE